MYIYFIGWRYWSISQFLTDIHVHTWYLYENHTGYNLENSKMHVYEFEVSLILKVICLLKHLWSITDCTNQWNSFLKCQEEQELRYPPKICMSSRIHPLWIYLIIGMIGKRDLGYYSNSVFGQFILRIVWIHPKTGCGTECQRQW